jgi:hypothetical protein
MATLFVPLSQTVVRPALHSARPSLQISKIATCIGTWQLREKGTLKIAIQNRRCRQLWGLKGGKSTSHSTHHARKFLARVFLFLAHVTHIFTGTPTDDALLKIITNRPYLLPRQTISNKGQCRLPRGCAA